MGQDGSRPEATSATLQADESCVVEGAAPGLWNLGRLQRGSGDPTSRRHGAVWWRASTTPEGTALLRLEARGLDVDVRAWGEGSGWALRQVPRLLGRHDVAEFVPDDEALAAVARRTRRPIGATDLFTEQLAPTVIEQKVTGAEAFGAFRLLVRRFGSPAPGPAGLPGHPAHGLMCPPTASGWTAIPSWEYLQAGVEHKRAAALVRCLQRADAIERLLAESVDLGVTERGERLERALVSLPGIGPWTAAKVRQGVLGDPDAWSIDDYHVPGFVARALGGDDAADATLLLERFRPHRYRVELLAQSSGLGAAERRGPRRSLPTHLPVEGQWGRARRSSGQTRRPHGGGI